MRYKVLIVEDNPMNMRLIEMILKSDDYTLLKAVDGEEALAIATIDHPDLILMDIRLPKVGGLEVAKRLKKNAKLSHIPIIALTAHAMKGDMEKAIEAGCDSYVSKPIDTHQLPKLVANMLSPGRRKLSPAKPR
jgi:two-component system cell cycle response regulator DivK